jgi:hypothetical protein
MAPYPYGDKGHSAHDKPVFGALQSPTALIILVLLLVSVLVRDVVTEFRSGSRSSDPEGNMIRLGLSAARGRRPASHPDEIVLPPPVRQPTGPDFCTTYVNCARLCWRQYAVQLSC